MSDILTAHKELSERAAQIGEMVTKSLEMSIFKQAERDLQKHQEAQDLIADLQQKQAQGSEVDHLLDRLEGLDVVRHFTVAQQGLSDVVAHVTKILTATLSDRLDILLEQQGGCGSCPSTGCDGTSGNAGCEGGSTSCHA
ncbi:YlbF family regulator [Tumebacillus lipolyticus]|uniref:YlbF family regulator n=1 Tax=Tumebacillus lipolyticus TaxID=1280370 RepID=A0ABW4ZRY5_9BACL